MMRWKNHRDIVSLSKFLFASRRLGGPLGSQQRVHRGYGQANTHFRNNDTKCQNRGECLNNQLLQG